MRADISPACLAHGNDRNRIKNNFCLRGHSILEHALSIMYPSFAHPNDTCVVTGNYKKKSNIPQGIKLVCAINHSKSLHFHGNAIPVFQTNTILTMSTVPSCISLSLFLILYLCQVPFPSCTPIS